MVIFSRPAMRFAMKVMAVWTGCTTSRAIDGQPNGIFGTHRFSISRRRRDLNKLAKYVPSSLIIANIVADDALILPHHENPAGLNFREPHEAPCEPHRFGCSCLCRV
jgi:hypothetical protein